MFVKYNKKLKYNARTLRRNMTDAEKRLWSKFRKGQVENTRWYRQKPIGDVIVDFYCPQLQMIIEIDGGQHYETEGQQKDRTRDRELHKIGLTVLRFTNIEILKNIEGVLTTIDEKIKSLPASLCEREETNFLL